MSNVRATTNLPPKQRLAMEFRAKLANVTRDYPYITISIDDEELSSNIEEVLQKTGFICQSNSGEYIEKLLQFIIYSLKKDHLVLVHFRTKVDSANVITLLRKLKAKDPRLPFKNIIPVFIAKASSTKQQQLFKLLGGFDVRYATFLEPGASVEKKIEDILTGLHAYYDSLTKRITGDVEDPDISLKVRGDNETIVKYKELIDEAEGFIKSNPEKAIELFTKAIELNPDFDALMKRGDTYYSVKEYVAALNDYREANKLNKGKASPHAKIGVCCFAMLEKSAELNETNEVKKWFEMGFEALNKAEDVVKEMEEKGVFEKEVSAELYAPIISAMSQVDLRGFGLEEQVQQMEEFVVKIFDSAQAPGMDIMTQDIDTLIDYATLLARRRSYEEAEKIFRNIIKTDPESVGPAFNNFAVELRKNGEYGKAFQVYMELLQYTIPDRDIVLTNLITAGSKYGEELREMARTEEAISVYNNILTYIPNSEGREWVLCDLAMVYLEMQDQAQASSKFMEAVYINPLLMQTARFKGKYKEMLSLRDEMVMKLTGSKQVYDAG